MMVELSQLNGKKNAKQDEMQHTKERLGEVLKKKWKNKVMHEQYIRNRDRQLISEEGTLLWLSKGDLKAETESEIVAAQDQALNTKYYATKILHTETDGKCRLCQQLDETIDHIISACLVLAKEQYVKRHDRVSAQIHFNICKKIGVQLDKKHWYGHVPKSVVTTQRGKVTILWKQQVQTDRTIPNNKPDIIIRDSEKGTCMLIDIAFPGDRNVIKKEAEKILKYIKTLQ
jgi:5-methylcytosine-specific restriction endonuclease McrA